MELEKLRLGNRTMGIRQLVRKLEAIREHMMKLMEIRGGWCSILT